MAAPRAPTPEFGGGHLSSWRWQVRTVSQVQSEWTQSLRLKSHSAMTIRFDSGWFQSSTSTFGQNTWSNVPPGCEWPPLLPPYCWQRFRMYILCCYTDYMIINIIVYDLIKSCIYTRCLNMYSIWSYYLNVINANAASFHPCILVHTLMTALHYHFVQQDSSSWWLGVCHWTVIFIAKCCHWKPDSIALSWYRHLRT